MTTANPVYQLFKGIILAFALLFESTSFAADDAAVVSTEHATVTLIDEGRETIPGQTLWLGLRFELIPHWHVYWRNPGASGAAPHIRWTLPDGWNPGDIHWPVPKRIRVGPLTNYGYEDSVTFLVPIQVPRGPLPASPFSITADAEWLVCREECIPEAGRFTLELNRAGDELAVSNTGKLFAAARAQWPAGGSPGRYRLDGTTITLAVGLADLTGVHPVDVWFAANEWGPVNPSGLQHWERNAETFMLQVPLGDMPPAANQALDGLLVVESESSGTRIRQGYQVHLAPDLPAAEKGSLGLVTALIFALAGGLILNLMPCVLPVLGIKVLGFFKEAGAHRRRLALHGLMYSTGILFSFALLAVVLLMLRAGGESLGWGFQLQSPVVVTLLAYLMLLIGLNLSGVFSVGAGLMGAGTSITNSSGLLNTFATGILAAVVASPCTAPFMGASLGFAITRPTWEALAVFLALGTGFALPVLLLGLIPAWVRFIPKSGLWMNRFQQILAFPMYATAAWLLWVLSQQIGAQAYAAALMGLVMSAFTAWLYGQWRPQGWRFALLGVGFITALTLAIGPIAALDAPIKGTQSDERPWSEHQVRNLTSAGRPVFVNFTAAWCITCKVNEQVALSTKGTRRLFASRSVAYLVADWTRRDPEITRQLERYGRSGVPLYLLYSPAYEQPLVLPQLLSEGIVADAIHSL